MNHLMIDLETMGNNPNAPIVAIGAVFFNPQTGDTGATFYTVVNLRDAMRYGAKPDGDTILWWLEKSEAARSAICTKDAATLPEALTELSNFITLHCEYPRYLKVWGNGVCFDNVILRSAYESIGECPPWQFWNDSDVRTMVLLGRKLGFDPKRDMPLEGVAHNALDDAMHQAKYVSAIWQRLLRTESNDDAEPTKYHIGDATLRFVFQSAGLTDISDMQAVFDRIESVLASLGGELLADAEREQIRREHAEWSQATFGDVGPVGPLKHLSKEALEAAADPADLSEWADMQFLLWDAQRNMGISDELITRAMIDKLAVNKLRKWPAPKDGEPRMHLKSDGDDTER